MSILSVASIQKEKTNLKHHFDFYDKTFEIKKIKKLKIANRWQNYNKNGIFMFFQTNHSMNSHNEA